MTSVEGVSQAAHGVEQRDLKCHALKASGS